MEREFIDWLKQQTHTAAKIGVGDDAAVLAGWADAGIVLTTDAIAEGTHFDLAQHSLNQVGRKAMAVNLSDIAAMGAIPVAALLTLMLPKGFSLDEAQQIFQGCQQLSSDFDCEIVGGDTNSWHGPLVISVTVIGCESCIDGVAKTWTMGGAQPGDVIVVSGSFGGSIDGHHLNFQPQVKLARYLIETYTIHAATDASDSLSLDLQAMATASHVGIELDAGKIPLSETALQKYSADEALSHALTDGEDFELILAIPQTEWDRLKSDPQVASQLSLIGRFIHAGAGFQLCYPDGRTVEYQPSGYSH